MSNPQPKTIREMLNRFMPNFRMKRDKQTQTDRQRREHRLMLQLMEFSQMELKDLMKLFGSSEQGIAEPHVEELQEERFNEISHEKPPRWYLMLLKNFYNPFVGLLVALGIASYFLDDIPGMYVLIVMILVSVLMRFVQEFRSSVAAEKLKRWSNRP